MKALWSAMRTMIALAQVSRAGVKPQLRWFGERGAPEVPHLQGPGIFFVSPAGTYGFMLSPNADPAVARFVGGGQQPAGPDPLPGEGGLHYVGVWKVYLSADGKVHLGAKDSVEDPLDYVALASKVREALLEIQDTFNNHVHVDPQGGSTDTPTVPMETPIDVASETVKCK